MSLPEPLVAATADAAGLNPVTGEAVILDLRPASFVTRGLAAVLDLAVVGFTVTVLGTVLIDVAQLDDAAGAAVGLASTLLALIGVPVFIETLTRGRSLGKWAAGLRVVRDDGGPIRARHALIRGLLAFFELYATTGSVAVICSLVNPRGKRVGDLLAGTYVIRERARAEPYVHLVMPPALAGWAATADLGRVPDQLALAARQFVGRAPTLSPQARDQVGGELLARLAQYVAPAPPGRPSPHEVLSAVLLERGRRDLARLTKQAAERDRRLQRRAEASVLTDIGTSLR